MNFYVKNDVLVEVLQWNGINQKEIHDFIIYLYTKHRLKEPNFKMEYIHSSDDLMIDIDNGSIVIYLSLNSYIVEVYFPEGRPFDVYGQEYFEEAYREASYEDIEEEFRVRREKYGYYETM